MSEKLSIKEEARQAIVGGGSYLLKVGGTNKLFTSENIHEFPSDAELAFGNPEAEALALEDIDVQMAKLAEAKKKLEAAKKAEATEAKAEEAAPVVEEKKEEKSDKSDKK